jgi:hypothetical protein
MTRGDYRSELELEGRLNAIASKAVRETAPASNHSVQSGPDYGRVSTDIPDASKSLRELQLEAQVAKISTNAIKEKLGWKPSKIKSEVTAEMIKDYQAEMTKPIELRDKDGQPVYETELDGSFKLDDAGKKIPKRVLYHPSSVDIDLEDFVAPHDDTVDEAGVQFARNAIAERVRLIEKLTKNVKSIDFAFGKVVEKFNSDISKERINAEKILSAKIVSYDDVNDIRRRQSEITTAFEIQKDHLFRLRASKLDEIAETKRTIEEIQRQIDMNDQKIAENRAEKIRVDRENGAKLKNYTEDLNRLNRGRLNARQEPGESDEDFKQRLLALGQMTVDPNTIEAAAELYNRDKLRERMKELTRDSPTASTVVKALETDEVFEVLKKWPIIKTEFLKVYGFDNKTLGAADFIEFFKNLIAYSPAALAAEAAGKLGIAVPPALRLGGLEGAVREAAAAEVEEARVDAPEEMTEERARGFSAPGLGKWVSQNYPDLVFAAPRGNPGKERLIQLLKEEGIIRQENPFARAVASPPLGSSLGNSFESIQAMMAPKLDEWFRKWRREGEREGGLKYALASDGANFALLSSDVDELYAGLDIIEKNLPGTIKYQFPGFYPRALTGLGAELQPIKHELPSLIEFGKVKISPKKLYYNNTLVVKHKSGSSFTGIPNVRVSDQFVNIILNLLKGKKPTMKDFQSLELSEKGIFDTLIYSAGLGKEVDNTFDQTKRQLKERLQLVEGEVGAGNTNPALKKEMFYLLNKMAHTGLVGYGDARRHFAGFFPKV